MLDEDDRENGPEYEKRLALYGEEERSSLAIDGAFQVAVQRQDDRWLIISHESAPRLGYLRILALRVTLVGILVLICLWFASRIVRPLQNLAGAANRFAGSIEINSIPLEGPDEVRTVAAAFNRMNEQIVAYLTERTTMLLAIAHDLRMPLARIRFQNALGSPNACTSIGRDIGQMERMIGTMLQFAEGKGGRTEMDTLDLPSLADAVVQNLIDSGSDVEFEQTAPITLIGDQVLLKRMLENLIDNAVKYGGSARVVTEKEGSVVHVEVSDDGPGMTSEQIAWACEPFYRADSSRGSERGGTGLGLTIVEMVASVHGGSVNIQNRNTGGLAVRVTLPLHGKA
ncbi:ATP-binding protein [Croceicoccus hydrothermalis]|uniref:ATP-binding protein n=1 Tax=Croceicoccus hydrothermalis TaxID=2867964 RepID=UPI001EFC29C8|nr:ATP-binding protein [Croceicoccus hydrothermalis]